MTDPQGNTSDQSIDTHRVTVQQYIEQVPLLLDAQGRAREKLRRFAVYLASFASPDGGDVFPSVDRVALWMNVSRRTVFRLYREAEQTKLVIREGHSRSGTIRVRLNLEYPFEHGWLPARTVAEQRRDKQRAYTRAWRDKKARGDISPLTSAEGGDICPLTEPIGEGPNVTQPSIFEHQEDQPHQKISDAADATPRAEDAIQAESSGTALAVAGEPQLSTPRAAAAVGAPVGKVRRLAAEGRLVPDSRDSQGRAAWSVSSLTAQLAACQQADRISAPVLSGPISSTSTIGRTAEARKAGKLYDPAGWQQPRPEYYETDRGLIVQKLVGDWIDTYKDVRRADPGDGDAGRVGREVRQALVAGNNPNHVWEAVKLAARKGSAWVWGAMEETHLSRPASAAANVSRTKGRMVDCAHGRFEVPAGLSRGDELSVSNLLARITMRLEHWEQLAALGVVKIG